MKKRLIFTNVIIVFSSLVLLLFASFIAIIQINENKADSEILTYLNLTCEFFDGTNYNETLNFIENSDSDIRLTIIDFSGNVLVDSIHEDTSYMESHLTRPEILNLGTIHTRYSDTLSINMRYLARIDNGFYVRIATPVSSISKIENSFLLASSVALIIILGISVLVILNLIKKAMKPINTVVDKLGATIDYKNNYGLDSLETLTYQIDKINDKINEKIIALKLEKERVTNIINSILEGIVVVDSSGNISAINHSACEIFKYQRDDIIDRNYLYLYRDNKLQKKINEALKSGNYESFELEIDKTLYAIYFNKLENNYIENGVVITFINITEQRNLEKMKRDFFANASHELKSPLTTIIGYQQMISEGIIDDEKAIKDATSRTIKEATRMNKLVSDMLELSKLESNLTKEDTNLKFNLVIQDVISSLKAEMDEKKIELETTLIDMDIKMSQDYAVALVRNLIENAIKYNKEKGTLKITLTKEYFEVADTGIGIPDSDQSHVFERFYRVDKGKSRALGSTGLGLAIVKHICSLYGFTISLISVLNEKTVIRIIFAKKQDIKPQ